MRLRTILLFACFVCAAGPGDRWVAGPPAYKAKNADLDPVVEIKDNQATLKNRGIIVTRDEYPKGASLSFTWKWTEGKEEGKYQDHLCVVFATDGKQRKWASEIEEGVVVRFNPAAGSVSIEHFQTGKEEAAVLGRKGGFTFDRNTDYKIRVRHEGKSLTVSIDGKEAVKVELPDHVAGKKLAVYNRECVAGILKQSVLTDLKIE